VFGVGQGTMNGALTSMWWNIAARKGKKSLWDGSKTSIEPHLYVLINFPRTVLEEGVALGEGVYCCTSSWRESGTRVTPSLWEYISGEVRA
jgi:hypothetical protein